MYRIQPDEKFLKKVAPIVKAALDKGESVLAPVKKYNFNIYLDDSDFTTRRMLGAAGFTSDNHSVRLGVNPAAVGWKIAVAASAGHEFNHVIRLQYTGRKDFSGHTLLDSIASEGLAQKFESLVYGRTAPYSVGMDRRRFAVVARKVAPLLDEKDDGLYREFFFGLKNGGRFGHWDGYRFSFMAVGSRIDELMGEGATWPEIMRMRSKDLVRFSLK